MKITILAEGSTQEQRLAKHWGLAILVDGDILFDTFGLPGYVAQRLADAGIGVDAVKHIAISHDDWDHVAGLGDLVERAHGAVVYLCPHFNPGIKALMRSSGARVIEVDKPLEIRKGIFLSGELEGGSRDGVALPEQYLAIKTPRGLAVITGCAHPGIVRIVEHAKRCFDPDVRLLIGGFHLKDNSDEVNAGVAAALKALGVRGVMPLHCTGKRAADIFRRVYGDECIMSGEGRAVEL